MKYNVTWKHNTGHLIIILKKNLKLKDTQAPFPSPYDLTEVLEIIESIFVPLKAESLLWVAFLPLLKAYVFPSRRGVGGEPANTCSNNTPFTAKVMRLFKFVDI